MTAFLCNPVAQGVFLGSTVYLARVRFGFPPFVAAGLGVFLGAVLILITPQRGRPRKAEVEAAIYEAAPARVREALGKLPPKQRARALNRLETEIRKYAA